jgi:protein phosphatase
MLKLNSVYAITDKGLYKKQNQDHILVNKKHIKSSYKSHLKNEFKVILCDGTGSSEDGNLASKLSCDYFKKISLYDLRTEDSIKHHLMKLNDNILHNKKQVESKTTIVGMVHFEDYYIVLNIGDSRLYRYKNEDLNQISYDHTYANKMYKMGLGDEFNRNEHKVVTELLGNENLKSESIHLIKVSNLFQSKEVFLLCSDGLSDFVDEDTIKNILKQFDDAKEIGNALYQESLKNDSLDNISIVVIVME